MSAWQPLTSGGYYIGNISMTSSSVNDYPVFPINGPQVGIPAPRDEEPLDWLRHQVEEIMELAA